jgi:cell wall-associated NlpC family hydrolase
VVFNPVTAGDKAVMFALQQLNKPYIWGGNGPGGYDCSGLALASWETADGVGFARVADDQYETAGSAIALTTLEAGDLVFWGTEQTAWTTVYHVAVYIGGDQSVQAAGNDVQLDGLGTYSPTGNMMPNGRRP